MPMPTLVTINTVRTAHTRGHSTPVFNLGRGARKTAPPRPVLGERGMGGEGQDLGKRLSLEDFYETCLDAAACLSPLIPNPSPPEYRREKGARSIKVLFGNSTPTTIFLMLDTVSSGQVNQERATAISKQGTRGGAKPGTLHAGVQPRSGRKKNSSPSPCTRGEGDGG